VVRRERQKQGWSGEIEEGKGRWGERGGGGIEGGGREVGVEVAGEWGGGDGTTGRKRKERK